MFLDFSISSFYPFFQKGPRCRSNFVVEEGLPGMPVQVNSKTFVNPIDGEIVACAGHLHEHSLEIVAKIDGKLICRSLPTYEEGSVFVKSMSVCLNKVPIKPGQVIELLSVYNATYQPGSLKSNFFIIFFQRLFLLKNRCDGNHVVLHFFEPNVCFHHSSKAQLFSFFFTKCFAFFSF